MNTKSVRYKIERAKGQKEALEKRVKALEMQTGNLSKEIVYSEKAQVIIQTIAQQTQSRLEYHISEIVTLALQAIFNDPYSFGISFVEKRGKTECEFYLERNGEKIDPMLASGGGVVDVISFALRVTLWSLTSPKADNVLVFDEPFRFLSRDLHSKASEMVKEISSKLEIQIIMVTHSEELAKGARIFEIKKGKII